MRDSITSYFSQKLSHQTKSIKQPCQIPCYCHGNHTVLLLENSILHCVWWYECLQRKRQCSLKTEGSFEQGMFYKKPQSMDASLLTYLSLSFCTCSYFSLSDVRPLKETSLALCGCSEVVSRPQALFPLWAEMSGPFSQDLRNFMLFLVLGPFQFLLYVFSFKLSSSVLDKDCFVWLFLLWN